MRANAASGPKPPQTSDDFLHVAGFPKFKKIRECKDAKPIDGTFLESVYHPAELNCVKGFGSASPRVHAIKVDRPRLQRADRPTSAPNSYVFGNRRRPICRLTKDLVISHHFEDIDHVGQSADILPKDFFDRVTEVFPKKG